MAEQVADDQDHDAQNTEDHHGNDSWQITDIQLVTLSVTPVGSSLMLRGSSSNF